MISDADLSNLRCRVVSADGRVSDRLPGEPAILPGSFHPVHEGHWQLAATAQRLLSRPVVFELSIRNVDKPDLKVEEVRARLEQFRSRAAVAITCAPLFAEKAALFPRSTFVVGADTVVRLVEPRYYGGEASRMQKALMQIAEAGCRFLVAGRSDAAGRWISLGDIAMPAEFRGLFQAISPAEFQVDISSSQLRAGSR